MQGFLHCVWSPRMPYSVAEKGGGEKKKKVGNPIGDPVRGQDAPINQPSGVTGPVKLKRMTGLQDCSRLVNKVSHKNLIHDIINQHTRDSPN